MIEAFDKCPVSGVESFSRACRVVSARSRRQSFGDGDGGSDCGGDEVVDARKISNSLL